MKHLTRYALAGAASVALLAGASSLTASAAPLAANVELKSAVASNTVDVQRRHWRGRRAAIGLGILGAGVVAGAAIANSDRGYYYDEPYGYYEQPYGYYQQPYGYSYYGNRYADPYGGNY